jgi:hypothetical protein
MDAEHFRKRNGAFPLRFFYVIPGRVAEYYMIKPLVVPPL